MPAFLAVVHFDFFPSRQMSLMVHKLGFRADDNIVVVSATSGRAL